jgi:hypothetical protein
LDVAGHWSAVRAGDNRERAPVHDDPSFAGRESHAFDGATAYPPAGTKDEPMARPQRPTRPSTGRPSTRRPPNSRLKSAIQLALLVVAGLVAWRFARDVDFDFAKYWPGNAPRLALVSVDCITHDGMPRAEVVVRNVGEAPLTGLRGRVLFGTAEQSGVFVPDYVPPDKDARMTVYPNGGNAGECSLTTIHDGAGRDAVVSSKSSSANPRDRVKIL